MQIFDVQCRVSQTISSIYLPYLYEKVLKGTRPVITAEWMYPGSCHPKSVAGLGRNEPIHFKWKPTIMAETIKRVVLYYVKEIATLQ